MLAVSVCRTDCADGTPPGFVHLAKAAPDAIPEVRYDSTYNFTGDRIRGYERPTSMLMVEAAEALKAVSDELAPMGCRLKIYDSYRPQRAVEHFVEWSKQADGTRMKAYFYPDLDKPSCSCRNTLPRNRAAAADMRAGGTAISRKFELRNVKK